MQIFKFYDTDQMGTLRPLEKLRWNEELFCVTLFKKNENRQMFFPWCNGHGRKWGVLYCAIFERCKKTIKESIEKEGRHRHNCWRIEFFIWSRFKKSRYKSTKKLISLWSFFSFIFNYYDLFIFFGNFIKKNLSATWTTSLSVKK